MSGVSRRITRWWWSRAPGQSGKTTLARSEFAHLPYFNLEPPDTRLRIEADPRGFLESFPPGVILDAFQRIPDLASYIQVLANADPRRGRFILTGSRQLEVMNNVGQSLTGGVGQLRLLPLSMQELQGAGAAFQAKNPIERANFWMFSGFYPRIHDQLLPPSQFEKFVKRCAGRVGQVFLNLQNISQDLGISHATASRWLTILQATYIVHLVQPYHRQTSKRLIKSPKLYFYDKGLATWLNGIEAPTQLVTHPLRGYLFKNMVVMEALKYRFNRGLRDNLCIYRDSDGAEVDLVLEFAHGIYPIEIKAGVTVSPDYFKEFKHLAKIVAPPPGRPPNGGGLVYGGNDVWEQAGTQIVGFEHLAALMQACGADA